MTNEHVILNKEKPYKQIYKWYILPYKHETKKKDI